MKKGVELASRGGVFDVSYYDDMRVKETFVGQINSKEYIKQYSDFYIMDGTHEVSQKQVVPNGSGSDDVNHYITNKHWTVSISPATHPRCNCT